MQHRSEATSIEAWFGSCSEKLRAAISSMEEAERDQFLLSLTVKILEFSAYELATIRDPASIAHLIRMATEVDRMIDGSNIVTLPKGRKH